MTKKWLQNQLTVVDVSECDRAHLEAFRIILARAVERALLGFATYDLKYIYNLACDPLALNRGAFWWKEECSREDFLKAHEELKKKYNDPSIICGDDDGP